MKCKENCFFRKLGRGLSDIKAYLFSYPKSAMYYKASTLAAIALSLAIITGTTQAENTSHKQEKIICETKAICQQLSQSIQVQINELEAKGLSNLSREERIQLITLKKQLIALENNKQTLQQKTITSEKSETQKNNELIANENKRQEQLTIEQNQKLDELRGILLDK